MNWGDEKYVKLYSRDTLTWRSWPWQAKALWPLILRKLDGAGCIETGRMEPAEAIALQVEMPAEVVRPGLDAILASGTLESVTGGLIAPHYVEAQEARKTEAAKKRDQRERTRDQRRATQVDEIRREAVPTPSHGVPPRPALSPSIPSSSSTSARPQPSPSPSSASTSAPIEDVQVQGGYDIEGRARRFIAWAKTLHVELANPGPKVDEWALSFFAKYQPADDSDVRAAFGNFLLWAHTTGKRPGWGLWLSERVWLERWNTVRDAAAAKRGAA